jgi:hypothetical protein
MSGPGVPAPEQGPGDERFTVGLLIDVGLVLEQHGYPAPNRGQAVELQQHLLHYLHGDPDGTCPGGVG